MADFLDDIYGSDSKSTADINGSSWLYGPNRFALPSEAREPRQAPELRNITGGRALPINPPAPRPGPPRVQTEVAEQLALPSGAVEFGARTAPAIINTMLGRKSPGALAEEEGPALAGLLVPVPGIKPGRAPGKHAPTRYPSLEAYVDYVKKSDPAYGTGEKPLFDWDKYLEAAYNDPTFTIGGRPHDFEVPHQKHGKPSPTVKQLGHPATRSRIGEAADLSLYEGPGGRLYNPWYWPHVMFDAAQKKLGPEGAHDWLTPFMGYNATSSMMTGPRRAFVEATHVDYNNRNNIPIGNLSPIELTGGAYKNKRDLGANMSRIGTDDPAAGITGQMAQKIRPYWLDLLGVGGIEPSYTFNAGKAERKQTPVTLDSIMAKPEAFHLRDKYGDPKKRWLGPAYTEGQRIIHEEGAKKGEVAGSDYQAAPWQTIQHNAYPDKPDYKLPHAAVVNKAIHDIAAQEGVSPHSVLDDIVHARRRMPNNIYSLGPIGAAAALPGTILDRAYPDDQRRQP